MKADSGATVCFTLGRASNTDTDALGLAIVRNSPDHANAEDIWPGYIVVAIVDSFAQAAEKSLLLQLEATADPIFVVPMLFHPYEEAEFVLDALADAPLELSAVVREEHAAAAWEAVCVSTGWVPPAVLDMCNVCGRPIITGTRTFQADDSTIHLRCRTAFTQVHGDHCVVCGEAILETSFYAVDGGKCHMEPKSCIAKLKEMAAPVCIVCNEKVVGAYYSEKEGLIHAEPYKCMERHTAKHAPKCVHCGNAIMPMEGRFNGTFFNVENSGQVHAECIDAYQLSRAEKCIVCKDAIVPLPGKYSGAYYAVNEGKTHSECMNTYEETQADKCANCGKGVRPVDGVFSGRYFLRQGEVVHEECQ